MLFTTNISKLPKIPKMPFFQDLDNISKTELETIFFELAHVGQNQDS